MAWRIDGADGRYLAYSRSGIVTADMATRIGLDAVRGRPVLLTPTGPVYEPTSRDDEAGIYLHGLAVVPGPVEVSGTPPAVPGGEGTGRSQEGVAD
jgi:hypothetical protein